MHIHKKSLNCVMISMIAWSMVYYRLDPWPCQIKHCQLVLAASLLNKHCHSLIGHLKTIIFTLNPFTKYFNKYHH